MSCLIAGSFLESGLTIMKATVNVLVGSMVHTCTTWATCNSGQIRVANIHPVACVGGYPSWDPPFTQDGPKPDKRVNGTLYKGCAANQDHLALFFNVAGNGMTLQADGFGQ